MAADVDVIAQAVQDLFEAMDYGALERPHTWSASVGDTGYLYHTCQRCPAESFFPDSFPKDCLPPEEPGT